MSPQRSSAVPLAAAFALLVAYATLYPFHDWHWPAGQGVADLLRLPWPPWRSRFDEVANLLGYLPLGALLYGAVLRSGGRAGAGWALGVLAPVALSYLLELTQNFLPNRVPSMRDWCLNSAGALLGVLLAAALQRLGVVDRWQSLRERWFVRESAGALVLLLLWPIGLLFPAPLPLGLGHIGHQLRIWAEAALRGTPWAEAAAPLLSEPALPLAALSPAHEWLAIVLGLLAPCLVAFAVTRRGWRRAVLALGATALAVAIISLSTALNFGPDHAFTWFTPLALNAGSVGLLLALLFALVGRRVAAGLGLVVLTALVAVVAQAPSDPYHAASLQAWERGRFIHFHGLARWVGWLWPYAAIGWLLTRLAARDDDPRR
jgi:VanZ family protein